MRILLTGATGYLGSHLAQAWLAAGAQVRALKRSTSSTARIDHLPQLELLDIECTAMEAALDQVDVVVHTATSYGRMGETPDQVAAANLAWPSTLLDAARRAGISLFINTDTVLDPSLNAYASAKSRFAAYGRACAATHPLAFVNVRLQHFYGAGDGDSKFISHLVRSCIGNVPELALTAGEQRRDFIHIDDVVTAYQRILERALSSPGELGDIDVGSGYAVTVRSVAETIHRLCASTTRLQFGALPYRPGESMLSQADTTALRALGWTAQLSLEQGLMQTIAAETGQP